MRFATPLALVAATAAFCLAMAAPGDMTRKPAPDAQEQSQAAALFGEVYKPDIDAAETADAKAKLAQRLLDEAVKARGAPADQFVLFREAGRLAEAAGDAETALAAADAMAERFDVDAWEARVQTLSRVAAAVKFTSQKKVLAAGAVELVEGAMKADQFEPAERLAAIALDAARAARDGPLVQQITARQEEIQTWKAAHAPVVESLKVLADRPLDPAANRVVGAYRCIWKGDWDRGVAMLALGDDPALQKLAAAELADPSSADQKVAVGDGWWDLGESHKDRQREAYLKRAAHWYQDALPQLPAGLMKMKIEKRIEELGQLFPAPTAAETHDNVEDSGEGDWQTLGPRGDLTRCHTLGPFSQSQPDVPIVNFIRKAKPGQSYARQKLTPTAAETAANEARFAGPTEPGQKMYYIFHVRTERSQNVRINVSTYGPGDYNTVSTLANFMVVPTSVDWLPLKRGGVHVLIVKLDHNKGTSPDESWISLTLRGAEEPIQQWQGK